jgi:hypothetical protein
MIKQLKIAPIKHFYAFIEKKTLFFKKVKKCVRKTSGCSSPEKSSHEQGHEHQTEIWIQ